MILNSPYISGSLTVTGNIISSGSITISGSIASASYASNAERVDGLDSTSFVFTSSYNTDSASVSTRVTKIEGNYATTGSNVFMGAQTVCANITSTGTIIAQTLNVQQVTSSIVYSSGSNIFGCLLTDRQQFTGSVLVTGSLTVTTSGTSPEFQVAVGGTVKGNALTDVHQVTGSLRITGSFNTIGNACVSGSVTAGLTGLLLSLGSCVTTDKYISISNSSGNFEIGTNSTSHYLQGNGNIDLKLLTNGSERARITSCGYLAVIGNQALSCVPYLQGMSFGWNRSNGQGESMINWTNAGGGSACDLTFNFWNNTTLSERLRITSTGLACFSGQVCASQASFVGSYVQNTVALNAAWAGVGGFTATLTCASGVQPYATYTFGNGNVVVSTNNPTIRFQTITTTTADMMQIVGASYVSSGPYNCNKISALNSSHLSLETGGSSRMLIDSDGNVVVGSTTSLSLTCGGVFQVNSPWGMSITNGGQALRLIRSGVNMWQIGQGVFTSQTGFGISDVTSNVNAFFIQQTTGNVGINCTAPAYPLHVNGQIYSSNTVSAANSRILNQQSSNTWTNNSANTVTGAIAEVSGIIRIINNLDGTNTDIPFYASGGSGVAYQWTVLDPDTGWLINQSGWNFNFTTNGSQSRTFNLQASNGSGNVTIQQASGTANYTMKIFIYSQA